MRYMAILLALLCGCAEPQVPGAGGCGFVGLAIAVIQLQPTPAPAPDAPSKCCAECNGTGKVRSGDGLALVPCECPPQCPCKAKSTASSCCKNCPDSGFAPLKTK
jgi:hypothetical protein